jgi:hypothetical protein
MALTLEVIERPTRDADYRSESKYRTAGLALAVIGLVIAMVSVAANLVAASDFDTGDTTGAVEVLSWSFGLNTLGFMALKLGIAVTLIGIIQRLWMRVDGVTAALPLLKADGGDARPQTGDIDTRFGPATQTAVAAKPLLIHRVAKKAWAPMLAMGAMVVLVGFVLSLVQSGNVASDPDLARQQGAWVQGLQFLGEGLLLAGISFLLGTILASLRRGGGEVQESLGVTVQTLKMPATAKAFIGLMAIGMMAAMVQFVGYIVAANSSTASFAAWSAWLGPLREGALGILLAGIVLALVTIGNVLGFQFRRINEIVSTGH